MFVDKNSTHHRDFLRHSQFCFCGQAGPARSNIEICINPAHTLMIGGTENPKILSKFAKRAARYNEFGSKCSLFSKDFIQSFRVDTVAVNIASFTDVFTCLLRLAIVTSVNVSWNV